MDEDELCKLSARGLVQRQRVIVEKVKLIDAEDPDRDADPRIDKLLAESDIIMDLLNPIVRKRYRDDPVRLAEWDDIYHSCDDLKEEDDPADGAAT
jgi:hypothetical protein